MIGTYDGTTRKLYANGVLKNSDVYSITIGYTNLPFTIGNYATGWTFNGLIDDVRVYNRALISADVDELYDTGKTNRVRINGAHIVGMRIN